MKWLTLFALSVSAGFAQSTLPYRISTFAGSGSFRFNADGSEAVRARLVEPMSVAVGPNGDIFFTDSFFHIVLRVGADGRITRFAGTGEPGFSGDGGPARDAQLNLPAGIDVDANGSVYVGDEVNHRIRVIDPGGTIRTIAGNGMPESMGDGGAATEAGINSPMGLVIDRERLVLYFGEQNGHRVRRIDLASGIINAYAGTGASGASGDGGPALEAQVNTPFGLGLMADGSLLIADRLNFRVRRVDAATNVITTVAGSGEVGAGGDGGQATNALLTAPSDVAADAEGTVYIADLGAPLRTVSAGGVIDSLPQAEFVGAASLVVTAPRELLAINGPQLWRNDNGAVSLAAGAPSDTGIGDGGPATSAKFLLPTGIAASLDGGVFIGDSLDFLVRRVGPDGIISTTGSAGGRALAIDSQSRLYAANGLTVLRFEPDGAVTTVAGNGTTGMGGDGGPAVQAQFIDTGNGLALDAEDDLYIVDLHRVRRVDSATGQITTIAGTGELGYSGDGGPATSAQLNFPNGVAVGDDGTVYIADTRNDRVRAVKDGAIRTVAEVGIPNGISVGGGGALFVLSGQGVVRITPDGSVERIAGAGPSGFSGDGGPATSAEFSFPSALSIGPEGDIYVVDSLNQRVRRLEPVNFFGEAVVNAANFTAPITPGMIASIFGVSIGPDAPATGGLDENLCIETTVGGVQVLFDETPAPIFFGNSGQLNIQVPYEIAGQSAVTVRIIRDGAELGSAVVPVAPAEPGIFAIAGGTGQIVAFNQDGTLNSAANPEAPGRVIVLYATGTGVTEPPIGTGKLASDPFPEPVLAVEVLIGGVSAQVLFAAGAPGFAGLLQANVVVPAGTPPGAEITIVLRAGEFASPLGTTIAVGE